MNSSLLVITELKHKLKYSNSAKTSFWAAFRGLESLQCIFMYYAVENVQIVLQTCLIRDSRLENMKIHTWVCDGELA